MTKTNKTNQTKRSNSSKTRPVVLSIPDLLSLENVNQNNIQKAAMKATAWLKQVSLSVLKTLQSGAWGEVFVFSLLEFELQSNYPKHKLVTESEYSNEFEFFKKSNLKFTVTWTRDNGRDIDLIDHSSQTNYQIEVKTDISESNTIHISGTQLGNMKDYKNKYYLYKVVNPETKQVEIQVVRNPANELLYGNELSIKSIWAEMLKSIN